jgi:membrane dipeptidase
MTDPRVFDGHNDTLLDLHVADRGGGRSFFERSDRGHVDLPRAREAGYAGGLFAIFVPNDERQDPAFEGDSWAVPPAPRVPTAEAKAFTCDVLARLYRLEREADGAFRVVRDVADLRDALDAGAVAALAHLEGAAAVEPDLGNLPLLYAAGVRSIGLTWSRPNAFGHGVPFRYPSTPDVGPGLTEAGEALVRACNEYGIVCDLAHLNERGFRDVAALSDAPLVVSHTAVHDICPSSRNLTDEQLDAVGDSGGVVGITFDAVSLDPDGRQHAELSLSVLADHVAYVADRIGVDHVAIGSDFDGCTVPETVGDVTGLPAVLDALRDRGFDGPALEKVARENWLRVLSETL